jgi:hypothetical protein
LNGKRSTHRSNFTGGIEVMFLLSLRSQESAKPNV